MIHWWDYVSLKFSKWPPSAILDLIHPEIVPFHPVEPNLKWIGCRVIGNYSHLKLSKVWALLSVGWSVGCQYSYFLHWCRYVRSVSKNWVDWLWLIDCDWLIDWLIDWLMLQVTLMVIDQNGRDHVVDAFRPDPTSSSFKRPTTEMNIASGCPLLMPLTTLDNQNNSYVKDNTAFIKIIVNLDDLNW